MPDRLVLVGFMGSGKSHVGALVARRLRWDFLDMDREIERRLGQDIATIFKERGESAFRDAEKALAEELAGRKRVVIAAGGGAFAFPATREALRAGGGAVSVFLRCDLETVMRRLRADGSRPLASSRERIRALFAEREPSYSLADRVVETAEASPEDVARRVVETVFGMGAG